MAKKEVRARPAPAKTFAVVGNGGSLLREDLEMLNRKDVATIVVNDVWQWAPWAWALYSPDYRWWEKCVGDVRASGFQGRLFAVDSGACALFDLEHVYCEDVHSPVAGLSLNKQVLRHGYSGGFQAMQIARAYGAEKIILLGMDYGASGQARAIEPAFPGSWSDFATMTQAFKDAAPQLKEEGIQVINATRATNLYTFPLMSLHDALTLAAQTAR